MKKKPYLGIMVVAAFAAFVCGCMVDSAYGDAHNANGVFLWSAIGLGVTAIVFLILAIKTPTE